MSEKAMTMKKLLTAFNSYLLKAQVLFSEPLCQAIGVDCGRDGRHAFR